MRFDTIKNGIRMFVVYQILEDIVKFVIFYWVNYVTKYVYKKIHLLCLTMDNYGDINLTTILLCKIGKSARIIGMVIRMIS